MVVKFLTKLSLDALIEKSTVYEIFRFFRFLIILISCLLRELTASQLVAIATRIDTGSHNRLDLIHSIVPPHYVCNGYISRPDTQYCTTTLCM